MELACHASDLVTFEPGHRVLHQGNLRKEPQWYVIYSGRAILSRASAESGPTESEGLGELGRGSHFGERSLLRAKMCGLPCISETSIDAGPDGLVCLTFDGEFATELLISLGSVEASVLPDLNCDIGEFVKKKSSFCKPKPFQGPADLKRLKELCLLGSGAFGAVFLVEDISNQQRYALKRLSKGHAKRSGTTAQLCWERDLLSMLDSHFVVRLVRTYKDEQYVYLLMEAALGGDLYGLLMHFPDLFLQDKPRGSTARFYSACVMAGLEHLHERKIIYRDMKPENIALDIKGYAKICDMGLARFVCGKTNTQAGTPDYMPPEVIDPPHFHDASADWWGLGVLTFEMLCRQMPFDDEGNEEVQARLIAIRRSQEEGTLAFVDDCPPLARNLVRSLLRKLPHRLGAEGGAADIRLHAFFKNFDFEALHNLQLETPIVRPWVEPEALSVDRQCPSLHGQQSHEPLFVPYADDGSNWDKDF